MEFKVIDSWRSGPMQSLKCLRQNEGRVVVADVLIRENGLWDMALHYPGKESVHLTHDQINDILELGENVREAKWQETANPA